MPPPALPVLAVYDLADSATEEERRARAFMMTAELFLMQHTCHWYCKSKPVASARLLARHQTAYAQVIDAVDPATRRAYLALVKG